MWHLGDCWACSIKCIDDKHHISDSFHEAYVVVWLTLHKNSINNGIPAISVVVWGNNNDIISGNLWLLIYFKFTHCLFSSSPLLSIILMAPFVHPLCHRQFNVCLKKLDWCSWINFRIVVLTIKRLFNEVTAETHPTIAHETNFQAYWFWLYSSRESLSLFEWISISKEFSNLRH